MPSTVKAGGLLVRAHAGPASLFCVLFGGCGRGRGRGSFIERERVDTTARPFPPRALVSPKAIIDKSIRQKNAPTLLIVRVVGGGASQQQRLPAAHLAVLVILKHEAGSAVVASYVSRVMDVGTSSTFQAAVGWR